MALTTAQLTRLRRMAGEHHKEATERMLTDTDLQDIADEVGLLPDADGNAPADDGYTDTYDLYRAASEAWRQKAGMVSESFDFIAEGGEYMRSQVYKQYIQQAARYAGMAGNLTINTGN